MEKRKGILLIWVAVAAMIIFGIISKRVLLVAGAEAVVVMIICFDEINNLEDKLIKRIEKLEHGKG